VREPTDLGELIRWFRRETELAYPARIHSRDYSEGGTPEWHGAFRAWLLAHPGSTDREGDIKNPYRFWLWSMANGGRSGRVGAEYLYRLACLDGDWLAAARTFTPLTAEGEHLARAYAIATLRRFWRRMQTVPHREVTPRHA